MNKKFAMKFVTAVTLVAISSSVLAASSWVRNEGETMYMADLQYSNASSYWDRAGVSRSLADINGTPCTLNTTSLYNGVEYGYSYGYTLFAGVPLVNSTCGASSASGFADLDLGVRGRLVAEENGKSWELKLMLPTGYNNQNFMRVGYGQVGVEAGLHFGGNADPYSADPYEPGYAEPSESNLEYGAMLRYWAGPPAPQALAYGKWSHSLPAQWTFGAKLEGDFALGTGRPEPINAVAFPRQPFHDVVKGNIEFKHGLGGGWVFSISPGMSFWGRNTTKAKTLSIGLHKIFGK